MKSNVAQPRRRCSERLVGTTQTQRSEARDIRRSGDDEDVGAAAEQSGSGSEHELEEGISDAEDGGSDAAGDGGGGARASTKKRARYDSAIGYDRGAVAVVGAAASAITADGSLATSASSAPDVGPLFRVGPVKERHATWADLSAYIQYYQYATQTKIKVKYTVSIAQLNAGLVAADQAQRSSSSSGGGGGSQLQPQLLPESLQVYSRTFVCVAGNHQHIEQERGARECPFRFMARVVFEDDVWRIQVPYASEHCVHNHPVVGGVRVAQRVLPESNSSSRNIRARAPVEQSQPQPRRVGRIAPVMNLHQPQPRHPDSNSGSDGGHPSDESGGDQGDDATEPERDQRKAHEDISRVATQKGEPGEKELLSADMEEEKASDDRVTEATIETIEDGDEVQGVSDTSQQQSIPPVVQPLSSSSPSPPEEFRMKEYHDSWEDFFRFVDDYMHATGTKLTNREGVSIVKRNNNILRSKQAAKRAGSGFGHPVELVPEEWHMYLRGYVCMRGWPKRTGREATDNAATVTIPSDARCPFRICAKVVKVKDAWRVHLPLHMQVCVHNHPVKAIAVFPSVQRSTGSEHRSLNNPNDNQNGDAISQPRSSGEVSGASNQLPALQVKEYHPSWEAFFAYIGEYMNETRTRVAIQETLSVSRRNKSLLESNRAKCGRQVDLVPEEWQAFSRRYTCTHGQAKRARGRELHFRRQLAFTGCEFRFTARVERGFDGSWCIRVPLETQLCIHNHPLTSIFSVNSSNNNNSNSNGTPAVVGPQQIEPASDVDEENDDAESQDFDDADEEVQGSDESGGGDEISSAEQHFREVEEPSLAQDPPGGAGTESQHLKEFHASWDNLFDYLAVYMRATSSRFGIKDTLSVVARNRMILKSARAKRGGRVQLIPESLKMYTRTFVCTQGWNKPSRGQGVRKPTTRSTECPFRFTAHAVMVSDTWYIHVPLHRQFCTHNHPTLREAVERGAGDQQQTQQSTAAATANSNLLDISAIPKDHPLYDVICDLAKKQQQQQQMVNLNLALGRADVMPARDGTNGSLPGQVPDFEHQQQPFDVLFPEAISAQGDIVSDRSGVGEYKRAGEDLAVAASEGHREYGEDEDAEAAAVQNANISGDTTVLYDSSGEFQEVQVANVRELHASWDSLSSYLETYMQATHTRIVIKDALNVAIRNKQIMQTKKGQLGGTLYLIPEELKVYSRQYICTHGWDKKRARGQGLRQARVVRATGCKFQFVASVVHLDNAWFIRVPLETQFCVHNHSVDQERFESYGRVRTVPKTHLLYDEVRKMVLAGTKRAVIYEYIRANSSFKVTKKDVYNMDRAIKAEQQNASE